jgi:hypothetical protein
MESTIHFEHWFHPAAAVVEPGDDLLLSIHHEKVRDVAAAFITNVTQVVEAARAPIEIAFWSRAQQTAIDEAHVEVWGDLMPRRMDDAQMPEFDQALARLRQKFQDEVEANPNEYGERMFRAMGQLEVFQKNNAAIRTGLGAVLRGMVSGMWTAFEILASDLWETALNAHPAGLAELKGKRTDSTPPPKKPFSALGPEGDSKDSSRLVKLSYLQAHSYDLSHLMGTVLREKFNFQILDGIRNAYIQAFDESHTSVREAILHPSLTILAAVRNVLVHQAGIVDDQFLKEYGRCTELQSQFPSVKLKELLPMTGLTVHNIISPVVTQSVKLINTVNGVVDSR